MVRTSRGTSGPPAPSLDAGALDDLDLDDMFAEDGDMLFDGLDIDLDGMGDITNDNKQQKQKTSSRGPAGGPNTMRPPPSSSSGPKTKRTNPMLANLDFIGDLPKRRKTKRKTKTPVAFGESDEEEEEPTLAQQPLKKKQRKGGAATGKNQKGKAAPAVTTMKKTKKSKNDKSPAALSKTKKTTPPPMARGASATVAAAGRFGKRSSQIPTTTKVKRKKSSLSKSSEASSTPTPAATLPTQQATEIKPPKKESTYGGLKVSKTMFYPFMESVPLEPSMKARKQYPVMDKIISTLTTNFNAKLQAIINAEDNKDEGSNSNDKPTQQVSAGSAIAKLLKETYEATEKEKAAFTTQKKQALLKSIPNLRKHINNVEKQKLLTDLYAMCGLLTRQYNFLNQSLDNMNAWCMTEFNNADYQATYAEPVPEPPSVNKWPHKEIKVKIVMNQYKEPRGTELMAILPPFAVQIPAANAKSTASMTTTTTNKKTKKKPSTSTSATSATAAKQTVVVPKPKTYADCPATERRQRILEKVASIALTLEGSISKQHPPKPSSTMELSKTFVPEEDPPLHTSRMWDWLEKAGFYATPQERLQPSPETHPRGLFLPTQTKIQGHNHDTDNELSSNSLFDRLQSLLVEEKEDADADDENDARDGEEDVDNDDDDDDDNEDDSLAFLDEDSDDEEDMVDLSKLNLEERTFIHLKSAGLIQPSLFPTVELVLSNAEDVHEDDLVNVIGEMSTDLSRLTKNNNARISFLESALDRLGVQYSKQEEEHKNSLIARCQSLLKRNKEKAKKNSKQKKDDLNLPW